MNMKKTIVSILLTLVYAFVAFWFMLPAINLRSKDFYIYVITVIAVYLIVSLFLKGSTVIHDSVKSRSLNFSGVKGSGVVTKILLGIIAVCIVVIVGGTLISAEIFHA